MIDQLTAGIEKKYICLKSQAVNFCKKAYL
jgi:hypothetical protein